MEVQHSFTVGLFTCVYALVPQRAFLAKVYLRVFSVLGLNFIVYCFLVCKPRTAPDPATADFQSNGSSKPENLPELSCTGPSKSTPPPPSDKGKAPQPEQGDPAEVDVHSDYSLNTNTVLQPVLKSYFMQVFSQGPHAT